MEDGVWVVCDPLVLLLSCGNQRRVPQLRRVPMYEITIMSVPVDMVEDSDNENSMSSVCHHPHHQRKKHSCQHSSQ